MEGNREVKSDVFSMLLEDPVYALQTYNALNHSDYQDPGLVEICTMERGISLTVRNDASFFLAMNLNICEHQSTVCPNMPLRELIYVTNLLERYVKDKHIYGRKLVKLPTPRFAVLYNGAEEQPEKYEMKLSDAFVNLEGPPELELKCMVYNINRGMNPELLKNCAVLREYAIFVDYIRQFQKEFPELELQQDIKKAIDRCIEEDVLKDFLQERRAEVLKVTQLDFTFDRWLELEREESREEGRQKGREEERANTLREQQVRKQAEEQIRLLQEKLARYETTGE